MTFVVLLTVASETHFLFLNGLLQRLINHLRCLFSVWFVMKPGSFVYFGF